MFVRTNTWLNVRQSSHIKCNSQMKIHVISPSLDSWAGYKSMHPDTSWTSWHSAAEIHFPTAFPTFSVRQFGKLVKWFLQAGWSGKLWVLHLKCFIAFHFKWPCPMWHGHIVCAQVKTHLIIRMTLRKLQLHFALTC